MKSKEYKIGEQVSPEQKVSFFTIIKKTTNVIRQMIIYPKIYRWDWNVEYDIEHKPKAWVGPPPLYRVERSWWAGVHGLDYTLDYRLLN